MAPIGRRARAEVAEINAFETGAVVEEIRPVGTFLTVEIAEVVDFL